MRNWKTEKFNGTLLDIISDCASWLPEPYHLIKTQEWIIAQAETAKDNPEILLPVRRFKGQPRGEAFTLDGYNFLPVDNEPVTALYEHVRLNGSGELKKWTLRGLLDAGEIPASWACDSPGAMAEGWRFNRADTAMRRHGLKVAHIFDAGHRTLPSDTIDGLLSRYFRTMNPVNCFPFPKVKHASFQGDLQGDISENSVVQAILRGCMMEYLNNADAVDTWLENSDIVLTEQQLNKSWKLEAMSLRLSLTWDDAEAKKKPVAAGNSTEAGDDGDSEAAAPQIAGARNAVSLKKLAELLSAWVASNQGASIRLDGKPYSNEGNRAAWILFRVQHFTGDEAEWNGIYRFHGDTSIDSIREMLGADMWDNGKPASTEELVTIIKQKLRTARSRAGNRSLILAGHTKPDGFYCFHHS
jgi:hypothetical protein